MVDQALKSLEPTDGGIESHASLTHVYNIGENPPNNNFIISVHGLCHGRYIFVLTCYAYNVYDKGALAPHE